MKKIFLLFLSLSSLCAYCQDYTTIKPLSINHFAHDSNSIIYPIRIDSTVQNGDTTEYYNFPMIRPLPDDYYFTTKGASWLGKKVTVLSNGWNYFFNKDNDTLKINTMASVGDQWKAFEFSNGNYIMATVVSKTNDSILGLQDSVKTISFHFYNYDNSPDTSIVNGMQLKISKNYGFVKLFNFYEFPFNPLNEYYIYESLREQPIYIIGMSNPAKGWQNTANYDYFDFEVGQELHTKEYDNGSYYGPYRDLSMITRVLEKNIQADSVYYHVERCYRDIAIFGVMYNDTAYKKDTVTQVYPLHSVYDKLSLEFNGLDNYILKTMNNASFSSNFFDYNISDSLRLSMVDGVTSYNYILNAGEYYYNPGFSVGSSGKDLLYFQNSKKTFGTPLQCNILLSVREELDNNLIQIFSYSNEHRVQVVTTESVEVSIYNAIGALIETRHIDQSGDFKLPASGVYIFVCKNQKVIYVEKVLCK